MVVVGCSRHARFSSVGCGVIFWFRNNDGCGYCILMGIMISHGLVSCCGCCDVVVVVVVVIVIVIGLVVVVSFISL